MIQNYVPSQFRTIVEYYLVFDDGYANGFWFPCDDGGNLYDGLNNDAIENHKWCLENPSNFKRFNQIVVETRTVKDNAHGICNCGNRVDLYDMYYGACQCDGCGQWYSMSGQELLPPEDWQDNLDDDY